MSKKDFIIDPCSACLKKYDAKDINNINHCCYNTLAAFANSSSINDFINYPDAKVCYKCVERSKEAMGRNRCEFRLPAYPVFVQSPHYFPDLLQQTADPEKSREICLDKCEVSNYKNECVENCKIDYFAVKPINRNRETQKDKENKEINEIENFEIKKEKKEKKCENNFTFYLSYFLFSLIFIIFIIIFLYIILNNTEINGQKSNKNRSSKK